ncbi:hypothetical protein [Methylobacterium aquaticum]|jgi:hypothetical protein|uniref:Uncharacterized protein n=1 Tax=Methylobacterium aquaticum TaxID=270351 RepID=A0A0J6SGR5_9HYPH|nr:hypothetical protein [Methylobacterium aquaticum]KMO32902.1 hypothetical protein VP06_16640 [Methylobacterium aquaticum]
MLLSLKLPRRAPDAPRPSLRDRLATLKGSAAKVMRRQPAGIVRPKLLGSGTPSKAVAAALAAHEMAYGYALYAEAYGLPDIAERRQAEEEAFRALLHTPLTSDADRAAYAAAVISRQAQSLGDASATERDHPMAVAFRNIALGEHAREPEAMRHVGRKAEPEGAADPILAAIATSKAATEAFDAFGETTRGVRMTKAQCEQENALNAAELAAQKAVWQTVPTTPAGRRALVDFARTQVQRRTNPDGDVDDSAWLIGLMLNAFAAMVADPSGSWPVQAPATEVQPSPDTKDRARLSAEQIDLTALDVFQLSTLFEAYQVARFSWEGVGARPYSFDNEPGEFKCLTELGEVANFEEHRAAWIMDRVANEIATRQPEDDYQRNEILMARTRHEFMCNDCIHDNALLLDISRAWIV